MSEIDLDSLLLHVDISCMRDLMLINHQFSHHVHPVIKQIKHELINLPYEIVTQDNVCEINNKIFSMNQIYIIHTKSLIGAHIWFDEQRNIHRIFNKPAIICEDGSKFWMIHGKLHREHDLPAIIYQDNSMVWYNNGIIHRDHDRPAMIHYNYAQYWYKHGSLHREHNLPAVIHNDGNGNWYSHGNKV